MRIGIVFMSALAVLALAACGDRAGQRALKDANSCANDVATSPQAVTIYRRVWLGDGTDTPDKLRDPAPLTTDERTALAQYHAQMLQCRQGVPAAGSASDPRDMQYRDAVFQRSLAVYSKLETGELNVGAANRLLIESNGKFQADMARDHLRPLPPAAIEAQKNAEKMVAAAGQAQAAQQPPARSSKPRQAEQRSATPACAWAGDALNCTPTR
jgi:hypothetical protein